MKRLTTLGLVIALALVIAGCTDNPAQVGGAPVASSTPSTAPTAAASAAPAPTRVTVPNLKKRTATGAKFRLEQLGLEAKVKWTRDSAPRGRVIAQKPEPGKVKQGSTVTITVSSGSKGSSSSSSARSSGSSSSLSASDKTLGQLFAQNKSGVTVTGNGTVNRVLSDDNDGDRHQRFVLVLDSGQTLLIAHNIDIASRLPGLQAGDAVSFKGTYEWNAEGGTVHWTHHDPSGDHVAGYLTHKGKTYK